MGGRAINRPELIDAAGVVHNSAGPGARIVSLVPSLTELLFDLDLADRVVGRTAYCRHPADGVEGVPTVGGTKKIKFEKLRAVRPTHVIVNVDETPRALAEAIAAAGMAVIVTHPVKARDNGPMMKLIGGVFGKARRAAALADRFEVALADLQRRAIGYAERRVLYLIWRDPWMTVSRDTYIADVLGHVNWHTVGHSDALRYPEVNLNDTLLEATDLVLFSTEPYPFTERHIEDFMRRFPSHAGKALMIDAEMVSWYGSRAVRGLAYLADLAGGLRP